MEWVPAVICVILTTETTKYNLNFSPVLYEMSTMCRFKLIPSYTNERKV
jgi:hypothetical protein